MKKNILVALSAIALAACGNTNTNENNNAKEPETQQSQTGTEMKASVNMFEEEVKKLIGESANKIETVGKNETIVLNKVIKDNDTYYAIFNVVDVYDPNANVLNGQNGVNPKMKTITRHELMSYQVKNENGKPVIASSQNIYSESRLPGSLGESAKIWFSAEGERKVKEMIGFGFSFNMVDVDNDGTYELLACKEVNEHELSHNLQYLSTYLLTLADENGKVNGISNIRIAFRSEESLFPVQVDLDKKQVFLRRSIGMGSSAETCVDIINSHAGNCYEYLKEVNPYNEQEFEESCTTMKKQNDDNVQKISVEAYKKHCNHSSNIFAVKCMYLQLKDSK